ncbi:MAG: DUF21 domain-containing protein [Deltaproteobacteria bacterium]|nr:DUF21 domain-containing protein [Deltaproteobacteria bacterium]
MPHFNADFFIWIGIILCISQSAMFSGLNLAFFSINRLKLEIEASHNKTAKKILEARKDSNFLLTTILFGNVGINVLLALFSNSVMSGVVAFIFSTFLITYLGEIVPQSYFSRNAVKMAALFLPILKLYQIILYPVAKPSAIILDKLLGKESVEYFKEKNLKRLIEKHIEHTCDIDYVEGTGAINFLSIDDLFVEQEGEIIDKNSIISLPFNKEKPIFPKYKKSPDDPFLKKMDQSGKKWIIITDQNNTPKTVLNSNRFLRNVLLYKEYIEPAKFSHHPIIVTDASIKLGEVIKKFKIDSYDKDYDVIDKDIILLWGKKKKIITGADILGRLLLGISQRII